VVSRTGRVYLKIRSEGSAGTASARLESEFPDAEYRRGLLGGIWPTASSSLADRRLSSRTAIRDPHPIPRGASSEGDPRPAVADPLVTRFEELRGIWARRRPSRKPSRGGRPTRIW
jgi:hypothetical protein